MLAYLVIGIELIFLYTVFWYVFIRKPKPYEMHAEDWGCYDNEPDYDTIYGANGPVRTQLPMQLIDEINERQLYNFYIEQIRLQRAQLRQMEFPQLPFPQWQNSSALSTESQPGAPAPWRRSRPARLLPHARLRKEEQLRYGWALNPARCNKSLVERFFATLSRAISQHNLKTPLA